jgi:hypothetical protein
MTRAKAIRLNCLSCASTSKGVKYCTCDGKLSTLCDLWTYRFGCGPDVAAKRHGKQFVTPGELPDAGVNLDDCEESPTPDMPLERQKPIAG